RVHGAGGQGLRRREVLVERVDGRGLDHVGHFGLALERLVEGHRGAGRQGRRGPRQVGAEGGRGARDQRAERYRRDGGARAAGGAARARRGGVGVDDTHGALGGGGRHGGRAGGARLEDLHALDDDGGDAGAVDDHVVVVGRAAAGGERIQHEGAVGVH